MFDTYKGIFNKRAQAYHEAMQSCPLARENEFSKIIELTDLKDGDLVCDIPSGGCYLSQFLKKKVKLVSVETSIEFIKYGKSSPFHKRILCADLGSIPLESNCSDKIISLAGLHHLKAKMQFYQEAFRLLKRGGILSIADVKRDSDVARFLNVFVHENSSMGHTGDFIDEATQKELERAGFRVEYASPRSFFWEFDSQEDITRFYKLLFGMDLASDEKVLDGVRSYLNCHRENGKFCANWELFYFKAIKP